MHRQQQEESIPQLHPRWIGSCVTTHIAAAGCILPTAKLGTEKPRLFECDPGDNPLELSFNIDPDPSPDAPATC